MEQTDVTSRIFHIYRLGLSGILLTTYLLIGSEFLEEIHAPAIFFFTSLSWFFIAAITSFSTYLSRGLAWLSCASFLIDMLALSILGWASGGLNGGILFLMLPSAVLAGLILPPRFALLVAAAASIGTLTAHTFLIFSFQLHPSVYFPSGVLGIMLFLSTFTSSILAERISVTEAKAQENRRMAEAYLKLNETIIERMQTGVVAIDRHQRIKTANLAAQQMLNAGLSNKTLVDQELTNFPKFFKAYKAWIEKPHEIPPTFTHDFSGVSIQANFSNLRSGDDLQTLAWLEDTRSIRQRAQQFKYKSLSKLSSGLAHEIRNPLSAVQQANDLLLLSKELSESDKELTGIIERHCLRMNDIIDVVQQLSRKVESRMEPLTLDGWLPVFLDEFQETQNEKINISFDIEPNSHIYFDPRHLKQILTNLLENAIRYGDNNDVSQSGIKTEPSANSRLMFIDIEDSGSGIAKKDQAKIFDPFYTTSSGGSGLGLYLSRELCEANYASINYLYKNEDQASGYFRITCSTKPIRH